MAAAADQLLLDFESHGSDSGFDPRDSRQESRPEVVRQVEYAPFPRTARDSKHRTGYTRNESDSGMCLGVERCVAEGALLRVTVRGIDGQSIQDSIARVVWCRARENGGFWIGLAVVSDGRRQMLGVRHTRKSRQIEVVA